MANVAPSASATFQMDRLLGVSNAARRTTSFAASVGQRSTSAPLHAYAEGQRWTMTRMPTVAPTTKTRLLRAASVSTRVARSQEKEGK